jgi:hypothetical protein
MKAMHDLILPSMIVSNPVSRDLLFISMQMRDRDYQGEQRWWNAWKKIWMSFSQEWKDIEGLVQVVGGEDPKCFQNIVYREYNQFTYSDWNPKTISFDQ